MSSTTTRVYNISESNIKDQVASLLYAWGFLHDNEHVVDMKFGTAKDGVVPVTVSFKKEIAVTAIIRNGNGTQL